MARIKIDFPENIKFKLELSIRVSDLNYGGHVGHDNILTLMHEARLQLLCASGFRNEVSIEGDIGIVVADAAVVYKSESFYDDVVIIEIATNDFHKYGCDMYYRITHKNTGKDVAMGKTGIVCMDYKEKKIAALPAQLLAALQ